MKNITERIVEILKNSKQIADKDLDKALESFKTEKQGKFQEYIIKTGLISEKNLKSVLSAELKIPFLNLERYKIDYEAAKLVPEKTARRHQVAPISKMGNTLTLAMSDPFNIVAIDDIAALSRHKIESVISTEKDIETALNQLYVTDKEKIDELLAAKGAKEESVEYMRAEDDMDATYQTDSKGSESQIVKIVDTVLKEAFAKRASDIHIEPLKEQVRVRYRIDGNLREVLSIPKKNQNAVLSRLKIMSRLDITENRIPQDGRFKIKMTAKEVDFRVSVLPVQHGGKIVMRLLDKKSLSIGLDNLGFSADSLTAFKDSIKKPFGMILITGPTGSGKSTTLYSILNQLNTPDKNIITIEDPIEYQVKGISQIQARSEIGLNFASGLRAILRQSPDVVMVGEIRDSETADIAIKASLTGQLVLSTLHTNDAAGAMTRLVDMHIEPFLIASSVIMVAAQRLCRTICSSCKETVDIPLDVIKRLNVNLERIAPDKKSWQFYHGKGCAKCNNTGFYGRMGVLETMVVDNKIRDMVIARASSYEIKDYAVKKGMITLREEALRKCFQGETTLDEVIRITSEDEGGKNYV